MIRHDVEALLDKVGIPWDEFDRWMYGQTYGWVDGEADYYEYDVNRFLDIHENSV